MSKPRATYTLEEEVIQAVKKKAEKEDRSKSYIANKALKKQLIKGEKSERTKNNANK